MKILCLSSKEANRVPCSVAERAALAEAGLGEKKVCIPDIASCTWEELKGILVPAFPKLDGCGRFDLLRCIPNTKALEPISLTVDQSPKLLKGVVVGGRIFIRPIQQNLSLDAGDDSDTDGDSKLDDKPLCMPCISVSSDEEAAEPSEVYHALSYILYTNDAFHFHFSFRCPQKKTRQHQNDSRRCHPLFPTPQPMFPFSCASLQCSCIFKHMNPDCNMEANSLHIKSGTGYTGVYELV